jgi:hypothetical protein
VLWLRNPRRSIFAFKPSSPLNLWHHLACSEAPTFRPLILALILAFH